MFYLREISVVGHGTETAQKLLGSTPHDQLLIQISNSFAGLLLFVVGFLVFMVASVKDREFQNFFAKGCALLHVVMALWRFCFERRVEDLAWDWPKQLKIGSVHRGREALDVLMSSWSSHVVLFLGAGPNKEEEEQGKVNLPWNFLDSARCKARAWQPEQGICHGKCRQGS
ncbi:hypothetical protein NC653_031585 [Populus alba x Populus x berolinensis]|uniref:DUF7865 domain-containing protein n=1 Tax=Populus alba x Populus x berolinensis TaxID=444605 RepID=A0AAD6LYW7_9ROSI|nr:hypothetical protein NC653_031585 [Populus alba x Populus x berolinensis]